MNHSLHEETLQFSKQRDTTTYSSANVTCAASLRCGDNTGNSVQQFIVNCRKLTRRCRPPAVTDAAECSLSYVAG
ncbi:unnamed protein product, partial [Iphiclides podalirius]